MNALLAIGFLLAATAGIQPEQFRALAKLPTINLSFQFGIQSSDFGFNKTNNTPARTEAELRGILNAEPTNSVAWCELGGRLMGRALNDHLHAAHIDLKDIPRLVNDVRTGRLSATDVRQARKLMDESLDCYSKTIQTNPQNLDGYIHRTLHRMIFRPCIQALLNALDDKDTQLLDLALTPEALSDFQQMARLCPDKAETQTTAATYTMMWEAMTKRIALDPSIGWGQSISEESRALVRECSKRLEGITAASDRTRVATAFEGLAMIHLMLNGASGKAQEYFQRAVALDPSRDRSWDMLVGIQVTSQRTDRLRALCADRVKGADTVRNRFILAKAHELFNEIDRAAEQLDVILTREPDNSLATTGKAAVLLRGGADAKAAEFLQRAVAMVNDKTDPTQRADLLSLQAIQAILRSDRAAAELHLGHAFNLDKDNKNARAILRAMRP